MADVDRSTILKTLCQELRAKQQQIVQASKLASIGELAMGVAHEINNPLNNILLLAGNGIDTLMSGAPNGEKVLADFRHIQEEVQRAAKIVNHLRAFAGGAAGECEPIEVNRVVKDACSFVHEELRYHGIVLTLELAKPEPIILGSAIQLEQVLINLIANARDGMESVPHKSLLIATQIRDTVVEIIVRDTGVGISADIQARLFDPFFTTKDVGKGAGLGLSVCYGIIKDHRGAIDVESQQGMGAMFTIQLPLAEPEVSAKGLSQC
jgi:C4-dicarboxylate-specific signal transduction histidine kinase